MRKPPYLQSPTAFSKAFTATSKMMLFIPCLLSLSDRPALTVLARDFPLSVAPTPLPRAGSGGLVLGKRLEVSVICLPCTMPPAPVRAAAHGLSTNPLYRDALRL